MGLMSFLLLCFYGVYLGREQRGGSLCAYISSGKAKSLLVPNPTVV